VACASFHSVLPRPPLSQQVPPGLFIGAALSHAHGPMVNISRYRLQLVTSYTSALSTGPHIDGFKFRLFKKPSIRD
jgi:hypothetical protein